MCIRDSTTTPGADGAYSVVFLVPAATTRVELATQLGMFVNDRVYQSFPGIADGINPVVFDDDYVPPVLHVSGTLLVDGNPVVTATTFDIVWNQRFEPSGVYSDSRTVTVTPDAAGAYSFQAVGPRLADDVRVSARIGVNPLDHPAVVIDPVQLGVNTVPFDVTYVPTAITLSGTCLLYTSPSPRDRTRSRMPSSA